MEQGGGVGNRKLDLAVVIAGRTLEERDVGAVFAHEARADA
jgi:hypothetical protein